MRVPLAPKLYWKPIGIHVGSRLDNFTLPIFPIESTLFDSKFLNTCVHTVKSSHTSRLKSSNSRVKSSNSSSPYTWGPNLVPGGEDP